MLPGVLSPQPSEELPLRVLVTKEMGEKVGMAGNTEGNLLKSWHCLFPRRRSGASCLQAGRMSARGKGALESLGRRCQADGCACP